MFTKAFLLSAVAALAAAQSAVLTFTHVPNPVTDGQAQAITYATNDTTTPVTITLRKGLSTDLKTVEKLTTSATGGQYVWTPSLSLPNGIDYALEISQGTQINYFGPFVVQGASAYVSSSASMSVTASSNVTTTTATTVVPVGTIGTNSAGTGTALQRNTTMSMATLRSASSTGSPVSNTATATSSSAGFQSATGSASASSSSSGASNIQIGSSVALFGAIVAAVFLQ